MKSGLKRTLVIILSLMLILGTFFVLTSCNAEDGMIDDTDDSSSLTETTKDQATEELTTAGNTDTTGGDTTADATAAPSDETTAQSRSPRALF